MSGILPRLRAALQTGMRQQVTRTGVVFTASLVLIAVSAFASANNLLFLILAAMLSTLLVSGFVSRLSLAGLEVEFFHPEHISARMHTPGRVVVRNLKWIPSYSIRLSAAEGSGMESQLYYPTIPGGAKLEEHVTLHFPARGIYRENAVVFSTGFPFGFTERKALVPLRQQILVYPSVQPRPEFDHLLAELSGEVESHFRGRGHDFYRIRPYVAFESARHVDWKASAHTGDLQVREFTKEEEQAVLLFLDLECAAPGAVFETIVDCCACVVWHFSQHGGNVTFCTQEASMRVPDEGDVYAILKYLATVSPVRGKSIPTLHDASGFQVVFSADPGRLSSYGWATETGPSARVWLPADVAATSVPAGTGSEQP